MYSILYFINKDCDGFETSCMVYFSIKVEFKKKIIFKPMDDLKQNKILIFSNGTKSTTKVCLINPEF